jgi:lysophospholipase L1-like esterase
MRNRGPNRSRLWGYVTLAVVSLITAGLFVALAMRTSADTEAAKAPTTKPSVAPSVTPSASATPDVPTVSVAFLGDSYAAGAGATEAGKRFSALVSANFNWREENFARAGTGYITSVTPNAQATCGLAYCATILEKTVDVIAAHPDIVIVSGGRFDVGQTSVSVTDAARQTFAQLRAGLPDAQIFAVSPLWDDALTPAPLLIIGTEVKDAVTAAKGTYLDVGQPLLRAPKLVAGDGINANDAGQAAIAAALTQALQKAGVATAP